MAQYKTFISYRKSNAEIAELIKKALVEEYGFHSSDIFLDKHDIGPEYFDTKLKKAVSSSSSLTLVVTKDCFIPKEDGEDWFLEEIRTALDNGVTIIPLLFDDIKSLNTKSQLYELNKSFDQDEIKKLTSTQSIRYVFDLSDATFPKLAKFIREADRPNALKSALRIGKVITAILAVLGCVFALFVGIGFLWGYLFSGKDSKEILTENTHIEGNVAIFEFGGLEARYDLDQDSIFIDLEDFKGELPQSNFEILAHSCSVSGAMLLFNNNLSTLKYFKFLKGGSKPSKYAMAGLTVAVCIGSFCGFSQGSKWGRTLKQHEEALALFPQLRNKDAWAPVFAGTRLNIKYLQSRGEKIPMPIFAETPNVLDSINTFVWCMPDEEITIAKDAGLNGFNIVCKFNNWEIGKNTPNELSREIDNSRDVTKNLIVFEVDSMHQEIKQYSLPIGIVGIVFRNPTQTTDISFIVDVYSNWLDSLTD